MKERGRSKVKHKLFEVTSQKTVWLLIMLFGYLGYYAEIRPYFLEHHGDYSVGFLDGLIVAITLVAILFYLLSILVRKKLWVFQA